MKIKFEYIKDLPPPRLGDGLIDLEKPLFERVNGELEIEEFIEQILSEGKIRELVINVAT